jgi:hypothetical protein
VGRRRADASWLPVQRKPFNLGSTYPLATIRVLGRAVDTEPPSVEYPVGARFGESVELVGYNLEVKGDELAVSLFWQALSAMGSRRKIFLHLVGPGGTGDLQAQSDLYPRLPSTSWLPGEYLSDEVSLVLPKNLLEGEYDLLLGWYDEATGERLPVFDAAGQPVGDNLVLAELELGE